MKATIDSPLGPLTLSEAEGAIVSLRFRSGGMAASPLLSRAAAALTDYFAGSRAAFDLPLRHGKSGATAAVLDALTRIPHGETRTYGEIATELGLPAQVVGQACGANPLPILIPCHRVLAANGLGGYSGASGVECKVALLRLEGAASLLL